MWPCRSGKRLLHTALLQERCKCGGSILLAAVAVKCQIGRGISFAESYPKCTGDQIRAGIAGYAIADDFPGKEVENDAQIKPVIVELEVCNITDPCLIRMFCGKLLLQQVLLAVFLMLFKLLFGIKSNAAQIELLHDRSNALGADSDTTFGQCNANLFRRQDIMSVLTNRTGTKITGQLLTNKRDVPFILGFRYPLEKKFTLTELEKRNNKELQGFLDKVSQMSVQQVDESFARKPDKDDTYRGLQVYHYEVTKSFRIHVVSEDGIYKIIRLDPNHRVHE